MQQSRVMSPTQMPTMHQNSYHPPQNAFANGNPYGMQSASPHGHLYGYGFKSPSYGTTTPYAVSPLSPSYAMPYPMASHLTSQGAPQIQLRLATSGPHHGALFRELSAPFVALSAEQQLADLRKQNAALKTELQKAKVAAKAQVQRLTTALEKAKSQGAIQLTATEAAVAQGQPSEQHFAKWQFWDDCLLPLKQLDDTALMEIFMKFADIQTDPDDKGGKKLTGAAAVASTDALDQRRFSKQGLAALFAAQNKTLSDAQVEEIMLRIGTKPVASTDALDHQALDQCHIDWHEFRALVRSELEMIFKGLPLERVLAACFAQGAADDPLEAFFNQKPSDVVTGVLKAGHILVAMVAALITKHKEARGKLGAGGAKYKGEFKGATVEKFFEGVTGICGEPHPGV